jgi:hypothetical protein
MSSKMIRYIVDENYIEIDDEIIRKVQVSMHMCHFQSKLTSLHDPLMFSFLTEILLYVFEKFRTSWFPFLACERVLASINCLVGLISFPCISNWTVSLLQDVFHALGPLRCNSSSKLKALVLTYNSLCST